MEGIVSVVEVVVEVVDTWVLAGEQPVDIIVIVTAAIRTNIVGIKPNNLFMKTPECFFVYIT